MSVPGRARKRTLRNVYGVESPTVGSTSFSMRLHIYRCAVTYITEISLHVTLSNQSHSLTHSIVGWLVVLRIYVASVVFQPYRDLQLEAGDNQSLKKWRRRESNPGPLAPQAKSFTTRPPPLPLRNSRRVIEYITTLRKGQGNPIRVPMICNPQRGLPSRGYRKLWTRGWDSLVLPECGDWLFFSHAFIFNK